MICSTSNLKRSDYCFFCNLVAFNNDNLDNVFYEPPQDQNGEYCSIQFWERVLKSWDDDKIIAKYRSFIENNAIGKTALYIEQVILTNHKYLISTITKIKLLI